MAEQVERKLTPAQIMLIVVVGALVVLFAVLLAGRLGGGSGDPGAEASAGDDAAAPQETEGGNPGDEESAGEPPAEDASTPDGPPEYFRAPSGNIVCAVTADSADCVISNFSYEPADAASCPGDDAGGHLRVEPAGASMPCEPLVVAGDVPVLDYGETTTAHGYTCASEETGITCTHEESGYGFSLARAAYEVF